MTYKRFSLKKTIADDRNKLRMTNYYEDGNTKVATLL